MSLSPQTIEPFRLTPMQSGMLYQSLLGEQNSAQTGYDIEQVQIELRESIDPSLHQVAWNLVAAQYPALRVAFDWRSASEARQQVQAAVTVPIESVDWRGRDIAETRRHFLRADRVRGFELDRAPLMRITVARTDDNRSEYFWSFHHILIDGRSFHQVLQGVFSIGDQLSAGASESSLRETLAELPFLAPDYVRWLEDQDDSQSTDYYRQQLADKQSSTALPLADLAGRGESGEGYGRLDLELDQTQRESLEQLAKRANTTMGCLLQSAWAVLLYRLTGDSDVMFGVTRSCRSSVLEGQLRDAVGLFINTLPTRLQVEDQTPVDVFLSQTRQQWIDSRPHVHVSLAKLQSASHIPKGTALFDSVVMYEDQGLNKMLRRLDSAWQQRDCRILNQPSPPLTLIGREEQTLELSLVYDQGRYQAATIERLSRYLLQVLSSFCEVRTLGEISILPPNEYDRIVYQWNDTRRPFPDQRLIHQAFEARVDQRPDSIAVKTDNSSLSYLQLEAAANRVANLIRSKGIGCGEHVAVCLPRDERLVIALLGIAKSGAAYLPIEPSYPKDRANFMLADARAKLLLTDEQVQALDCESLTLDSQAIRQSSEHRPAPIAQAEEVCYALYTSGSTGKPKGVQLPHRAVVNTLDFVSRSLSISDSDRALFVTSPCFDLSVYDVFGVLGVGGSIVVASDAQLAEPEKLLAVLLEQDITVWNSAPAVLARLLPLMPKRQIDCPLRRILLSGDSIPLDLPEALQQRFPQAGLFNLGGATETAIWDVWYPITCVDSRWTSIPYGKPIQNTRNYVLDKQRRPVPAGVTGDLYSAGTCVAKGYLRRPELTRERFLPDPFVSGERMYMTGDLARYFDDGTIEFLGRADFQVKIRGHRVELGEIESALLACESVASVVCTAFADASGNKAIAGYVTPSPGQTIEPEALKQALAGSLPSFMVPSRLIVLDEMPLSSNGKLDRKALPPPNVLQGDKHAEAPANETEARLGEIWKSLLKLDRVSREDNFFDLGGNSLLVVSLGLEIRKRFAIELPLSRVLEQPTLRGLAEVVREKRGPQKRLASLNPEGGQTPMVLFSGVGGYGFFFYDFARAMGPDWPVHVAQAIGVDGDDTAPEISIEEMAALYEPEVLRACPQGPVILGGYSFGALLAYEMFRRLRRQGRRVQMMVSFDGPAPGYPRKLPTVQRLLAHWKNWHALEGEARSQYLSERLSNLGRRFKRSEVEPGIEPPSANPQLKQRLGRVESALWQARDRYDPGELMDCPVLLLGAEQPVQWPGCEIDELYGWSAFSRQAVTKRCFPGAHLSFFDEANNAAMADSIKQALSAADG